MPAAKKSNRDGSIATVAEPASPMKRRRETKAAVPAVPVATKPRPAVVDSNVLRKGLACPFVVVLLALSEGTKGMTNPKAGQAEKASKT